MKKNLLSRGEKSLDQMAVNIARLAAPKYIQYLKVCFSVSREYIHIRQPVKSTAANQLLWMRRGVMPKMDMYRQSLDMAMSAKSIFSQRSRRQLYLNSFESLVFLSAVLVVIQRRKKFRAVSLQSSKNPLRAYSETINPSGSLPKKAPKR